MINEEGSNVIGGTRFTLKVCGKSICPHSFVLLFGISYGKLVNLVSDNRITSAPLEDDSEEEEDLADNVSQKDRICVFLKFLFDSDIYSEPMVGYPETFRRITLFYCKEVFVSYYYYLPILNCVGSIPFFLCRYRRWN